jgi:hypothetical protein
MTIAIYDTSAPMFFDGKLLGVTALKSCMGNKLALLPLDEGSNPSGAAISPHGENDLSHD